jgi:hypothetical protein
MPSVKERRKLIRPLLLRRPDLVYEGNEYLFFRTVGHYWRGVSCAHVKQQYYFYSFVYPLFAGDSAFRFRASGGPFNKHYWQYVDPSWPSLEIGSAEICDLLERRLLPTVAHIVHPEELAKSPMFSDLGFDAALGACFIGNYDEAERHAAAYVAKFGSTASHFDAATEKWIHRPFSIEDATEADKFNKMDPWRVAYLGKILRTAPSKVPALLHDWEEHTVNSFKLNKYWTRTPFPCEG